MRAPELGTGLASSTPSISKRIRDYLDSVDEPKTISEISEALGLTGNQVRNFKTEKTQINLPYESKIITDRQMGKMDFLLNYFKKNPNKKIPNRRVFEEQGISRYDVQNFIEKYPEYRKNVLDAKQSIQSDKLKKGTAGPYGEIELMTPKQAARKILSIVEEVLMMDEKEAISKTYRLYGTQIPAELVQELVKYE